MLDSKKVILEKKINVPCPGCDADLVSAKGSHKIFCPKCKLEFTDSQLREKWDFL